MDIIKANEVLWHVYRPPLKGIFDNEEVHDLVGEPCRRMSLRGVTKAQLTAAVAAEASAQVGDDVINQEGELDEQYAAIKIDYRTEAIGEE